MYEANNTVQVNGVCLHYAEVGVGKPVVLVHGNGESHDLFDTEIRQLADAGYHVFAPDSRGHGANERLDEYHYADMAEDMYRFIRELQLEKPLFYGHSDGGIIGLLLETIRIPVLVTVGEHDLILPEETQRIVQHLPNAKLTVVEGEDHGSYIAGSETMGRLLIDFFRGL